MEKKKVLIVGAGGFVGSFLVEEALRRGYEVWAGLRATTSRRWLQMPQLHFLVLDFDNPGSLAPAMRDALPEGERWDYIVYNLGATKCLRFADFNRINYEYLRSFTEALHEAGKVPEKMLYISSLSVFGPGKKGSYEPFSEKMVPMPDTRYGASKLKAEMWLATAGIPSIVFRCTGIYGPREKDYFLMFQSIDRGFDFSVGMRRQLLTFLYVEDLTAAVFDALDRAPAGEIYCVSEGRAYSQKEFRRIAAEEIGRKVVIPVRMPLWAVKAVSVIAEKWGVARLKPSTLNRDKYHIMRQRNWNVDISKAQRDFGFRAPTSLREGIRRSVEWYRKEGWMK